MRSDLVIDGFGIGTLEVSGSDATDAILSLFENMKRNDINVLLLSGSVLSLYNIVDVDSLYKQIKTPTLALTFKKSKSDLERNIKTKFDPREARIKIKLLQKLGMPQRFKLKTGFPIFVRSAGVTNIQSQKILDKFTLQGSIPEPIRIARLLSKSIALFEKRKG